MISVDIPVRLVNGLNSREHWAARARRAKTQRSAAKLAMRSRCDWTDECAMRRHIADGGRLSVTIVRRGGRRMDSDGLIASAKHVRDGVADWIGIDDGDERVTWRVEQGSAPRGRHWADVCIELVGAA